MKMASTLDSFEAACETALQKRTKKGKTKERGAGKECNESPEAHPRPSDWEPVGAGEMRL